MGRLLRLDRTGHTTLAKWTVGDTAAEAEAVAAFEMERERGLVGSATRNGAAEVVRELPLDADLVVMRRQIAGG